MHDPPRPQVREALQACRQAGIKVVMVTGDQAPTAAQIAKQVGLEVDREAEVMLGSDLHKLEKAREKTEDQHHRLLEARVFARVSPEQKLDLIRLHQERGTVVAMTGDGVNDAPVLKKADIGIAMGRRSAAVPLLPLQILYLNMIGDVFPALALAVGRGDPAIMQKPPRASDEPISRVTTGWPSAVSG